MGMASQLRQLRIWFDHGGRLLWLRVRMLRLDAVAQIHNTVLLLAALLLAVAAFFLGFISLLFGLNSVLAPTAKIGVFFGLAGILVLLTVLLMVWVRVLWKRQGRFMNDTLDAMAEDVAYLNGRHTHEKGHDEQN